MLSKQLKIFTNSPQETHALGQTIGERIDAATILALKGDLGSGKTAFVQGLARGLDVPEEYYITSPTFTLINEYPGRLPLYHVDLYRLDKNSDIEDIGLGALIEGQGVVAIEWAHKLAADALDEHLAIEFKIIDDECRDIGLIAYGHAGVNLIKAFEPQITGGRFKRS